MHRLIEDNFVIVKVHSEDWGIEKDGGSLQLRCAPPSNTSQPRSRGSQAPLISQRGRQKAVENGGPRMTNPVSKI